MNIKICRTMYNLKIEKIIKNRNVLFSLVAHIYIWYVPFEIASGRWKSDRIIFKNKLPNSLYVIFEVTSPVYFSDIKVKHFLVFSGHLLR
jgi:hypothetical protein